VALTLGPAIITVASRFGLLAQTRHRIRFWRRSGAAGPVAGLIDLDNPSRLGPTHPAGYQPTTTTGNYLPADFGAANEGFAALNVISRRQDEPRKFACETDKDLRNSADFSW